MSLKRRVNKILEPLQEVVTKTSEELKLIKDRNIQSAHKHSESSTIIVKTTVTPTPKAGDPSPLAPGKEYIMMEVKGSGNKVYKVAIPQSYAKLIPKTWHWNTIRYKVAEMISAGFPMTQIADICQVPKSAIYGWLQHPEFKEHVDGITMETGWANKRERIAGLNRLTRMLFDKVTTNLDSVMLTDKSIGAVLMSIQNIAKQLGVEKEEYVEQTKVEQNTTISGTVGIVAIPLENMLNSKTTEERLALEAEFNDIGNSVIQNITGERD